MIILAVATAVIAAAAEPIELAATGLTGVGVEEARVAFFTEHLAERIASHGLSVVTPKDIASVLGLERQKQLLGCSDDASSCLSEIANALGVDGLVLGSVAKIGSSYQLDLKVVGANDSKRLAGFSARVSNEEALLDALRDGAAQLAFQVSVALGRPPPVVTPGPSVARKWFWVPAAAGVAFAAGGAFGLSQAEGARQQLATQTFTREGAQGVLEGGRTARTLGYAGLAVGAAGLITSGILYAASAPSSPVMPQVALHPGGAALVFSGVLP